MLLSVCGVAAEKREQGEQKEVVRVREREAGIWQPRRA